MSKNFRGLLYAFAKLLGDVSAIRQGKVGKRIVRRSGGRVSGRMLRKLFK